MRCIALPTVIAMQLSLAAAHSWVEQLRLISGNGAYVGDPGFVRGNVLRTSPGFSDVPMVHMIGPTVKPTDQMCRPTQQNAVQTDGSPRLKAPAGSFIALLYQENGHVTLPNNQLGKPPNRGSVFIYGTSDPQPNENFSAIHNVWNTDGTGGDKRGKLLATQNFDDGQCYQINGGPISGSRKVEFSKPSDKVQGSDLWCQNDIALPQDISVGKPYTLYWVWDWPTAPGVDPGLPQGKVETYTTCMDIDIVAGDPSQKEGEVDAADARPSLGNAAVPTLFENLLKPSSPAQAPQSSQPPQASQPPKAPKEYQAPQAPQAPQSSQPPQAFQPPKAAEESKAPKAPQSSQPPQAFQPPKAAEESKAPKAPQSSQPPEAFQPPKAAEESKAPKAPQSSQPPQAFQPPKAAEESKAPQAPQSSQPPQASQSPPQDHAPGVKTVYQTIYVNTSAPTPSPRRRAVEFRG